MFSLKKCLRTLIPIIILILLISSFAFTTPSSNQKHITIAVPTIYNGFLDNVRVAFLKKHPEYIVGIKEYGFAEGGKALNTAIMAGKGADLIAVNGLNYKKYFEKNLFVNLGALLDQDRDLKAKLDPDIIEACKYKGKLFVMPLDFDSSMLYANQTLLEREGISIDDHNWTWTDFEKIAVKITKDTDRDGIIDQYALPKIDENMLFGYILETIYNRFVDFEQKRARFNTSEFPELLKLCGSLIKLTNPQVDISDFINGEGRGSIVFIPSYLNQYHSLVYFREQIFHDKIHMYSFPGEEGISFYPSMLFAINKNSRFKNEAWELLQIMLSEELQYSNENLYFPVNLKARKARANFAMTQLDEIGGIKVLQMLTKEEKDQIDGYIGRIDKCRYFDDRIWKIVYDEAARFFDGEKTAEEVGRIIQNKVNTYLNE